MEVMKLEFPLNITKQEIPPLVMALGYFDGVHLGHQQVILEAKKQAMNKGMSSAVMTFDPHPSVVLAREKKQVQYITPLSEKIKVMEQLGVDYLFIVHFTAEFANLLPQEFVDQYIIGLNVKHVVAGFDYTYGRMGKGNMETLPFHSREQFTYTVVPKYTDNHEKVSSTRIRGLLKEGKIDSIPSLLGRYYTTTGIVIQGDKRGRTLGFPTANIELNDEYSIPPVGVYAVRIKVKDRWHQGVCNVGYKPTFHRDNQKISIEVFIFDFDQDIYGEEAVVEWHLYLRKEQKFSGVDDLIKQIEKDKQNASEYFRKAGTLFTKVD
ncbi:bifunctional riboflavin kinase/FAD synthetase [Neobacillus sp. OS1-32]|uniref:bifunctional riboflavin kinase/FAD synthetase n=1 Tax=Neobacillus sp. OS1-32 TaxID=3070682 RepID=UPI0035A64DC0